jgi:hypothetical protein
MNCQLETHELHDSNYELKTTGRLVMYGFNDEISFGEVNDKKAPPNTDNSMPLF